MNFFQEFRTEIQHRHPELSPAFSDPSFTPAFISPLQITLSAADFQLMKKAITAFEAIRNTPAYVRQLNPPYSPQIQPNRSICMGYDFFITKTGPKLIEINTNAAAELVIGCLNSVHHIQPELPELESLLYHMMQTELQLSHCPVPPGLIVIMDEAPLAQKTYFDMRLFDCLFKKWGWPAVIADPTQLIWDPGTKKLYFQPTGHPVEFIYNRHCDFLLQSPAVAPVRQAWEAGAIGLSPHPLDYALLADKANLIQFSNPDHLKHWGISEENRHAIEQVLPPVLSVRDTDPETIWKTRKHYFFKPRHLWGSKACYKGEKLTRKMWAHICESDYIAQPYFESETIHPSYPDTEPLKYDIRVYTYQDQIQCIGARLFAGQAMNFQAKYGGFASIRCVDYNTRHDRND